MSVPVLHACLDTALLHVGAIPKPSKAHRRKSWGRRFFLQLWLVSEPALHRACMGNCTRLGCQELMVEIYAPKHMNQNYYATVLTQDRTQGVCKDSL